MKLLYTPLEEMRGLCKYCVADCLRLELVNFEGTNRCESFEPKEKNWHDHYLKDLKNNSF